MKFVIRLLVNIVGGVVGNYAAENYLIKGQFAGDNTGIVTHDPKSSWKADSFVRVGAVITGAGLANKGLSMVMSRGRKK